MLENKKQTSAQIEDFPMFEQQNEEFGLNQSLDASRQSNSEKVKEKVNKLFTKQPFWKKWHIIMKDDVWISSADLYIL